MKGLEPSRREAHAPKACVSTNSTTSAWVAIAIAWQQAVVDRCINNYANVVKDL